MKVTLEYELPEDDYSLECAQNGVKYKRTLAELDAHLRSRAKYYANLSDEQLQVYEKVRQHLHSLLAAEEIDIY